MGSTGDTPVVVGQYMLPFIDEHTKNDDPWQRNYGQPPRTLGTNLVPRSYPLVDIRTLLPEHSTTDLLQRHGFGVVKHQSSFVDQLNKADREIAEQATIDVYHPEIEQLVKDTLGAKRVIVMGGSLRQGKRAPEEFKFPAGLRAVKDALTQQDDKQSKGDQERTKATETARHKLAGQSNLTLGTAIRVPHMDFTDQGARASIRHQDKNVFDAASEVIAYEDKICADQPFAAESHEANSIIDEQYNQSGKLGPRYAAYSIWRPLKKVERDPITLGPPGRAQNKGEMVHWPYLNRYKGVPELGGDFLKEFAMLGVNKREAEPINGNSRGDAVKWYYVSNQEPDEVLFIKQFDSASLGSDAQHARPPWHASPEIGSVEGDEPRESIDMRVFAFW